MRLVKFDLLVEVWLLLLFLQMYSSMDGYWYGCDGILKKHVFCCQLFNIATQIRLIGQNAQSAKQELSS